MKKSVIPILAAVLTFCLLLGSLSGCSVPWGESSKQPDPDVEEKPPDGGGQETADENSFSETGVLKLQWLQASGIDTMFEDPWVDVQSLAPVMLFDTLMDYEFATRSFTPRLATDCTESEDGLSYTITIRDNAFWHDGTPVTAADVVFTWNMEAANANASNRVNLQRIIGYSDVQTGLAAELAGVSYEGNVITVRIDSVCVDFAATICGTRPLPKHLLEGVEPAALDSYLAYWSRPVGSGPYVIEEVSFPDYCLLVRNDNYYGAPAGIRNVLFTSFTPGGSAAMMAAMIAGELDYVYGNSVNDINTANEIIYSNPDVVMEMLPGSYTRWFCFNIDRRQDGENKADLSNPAVRQAFDLAMDKQAIASLYEGQAAAISTLVNPGNPQYNDDIPLPEQDLERAREILERENFDFSQVIDLAYYYDDQTTHDIMTMIAQDFGSIGVNVRPILLRGDLATAIYDSRNFDLLYLAGAYDVECPASLYEMLTSSSYYSFIGDEERRAALFDDLFAQYRACTDANSAKQAADRLQMLDYAYRYGIPAYTLNTVILYNSVRLYIPEDFFEFGASVYRFDEWKLIG